MKKKTMQFILSRYYLIFTILLWVVALASQLVTLICFNIEHVLYEFSSVIGGMAFILTIIRLVFRYAERTKE